MAYGIISLVKRRNNCVEIINYLKEVESHVNYECTEKQQQFHPDRTENEFYPIR